MVLNQVLSAQTPPPRQPCFRVVRLVAVTIIVLAISRRMRSSIGPRPVPVNVLRLIMLT